MLGGAQARHILEVNLDITINQTRLKQVLFYTGPNGQKDKTKRMYRQFRLQCKPKY